MLSFFPRGVLDEILNLIESASEGFPSHSHFRLTNTESGFVNLECRSIGLKSKQGVGPNQTKHVLEDEYHFVLGCLLYLNLKTQYINTYFWKHPSMIKFIELVSTKNVHVLKKLSTYIEKAFKLRQDALYS